MIRRNAKRFRRMMPAPDSLEQSGGLGVPRFAAGSVNCGGTEARDGIAVPWSGRVAEPKGRHDGVSAVPAASQGSAAQWVAGRAGLVPDAVSGVRAAALPGLRR